MFGSCMVELPEDRKVVGSKWVYKVDSDGRMERCKARLVAQGFLSGEEMIMMRHSLLWFAWNHFVLWLVWRLGMV